MDSLSGGHPIVSIVVLAHRADRYLVEALESLARQSFRNFETILVLNGPDIRALESLVLKIQGINPVIVTATGSISELSNIGFKLARGRYVGRFDSDDVSDDQRFAKQVEYFQQNPDIAVLGGQANVIDESGHVVGFLSRPVTSIQIRWQLPFRCPMLNPSVLMRRDAFEWSGGYHIDSHAEDWDLWIRLAEDHGLKFANLPSVLISYRRHSDQTSGQRNKQFHSELKVLRRAVQRGYGVRYQLGFLVRHAMALLPRDLLMIGRRIFGWWQRRVLYKDIL